MFLLPTQLAFSCLFFFTLTRVELVASAAAGFQVNNDNFPSILPQSTGAYLAYAGITLWAARRHLRAALPRNSINRIFSCSNRRGHWLRRLVRIWR